MFENVQKIGEDYLKKNISSDKDLKKEVLNSQLIEPNISSLREEEKNQAREVIFNLNTKKKIIEIKAGNKELTEENKKYFYGFDSVSNNPKAFFTSNNFYYPLKTINQIKSNLEDKKYFKERFPEDNSFRKFINSLDNVFSEEYLNVRKKPVMLLNFDFFEESQKEFMINYLKNKKLNEENYQKAIRSLIANILGCNNELVGKLNIFTLTIDGKRIQETEFIDDYRDMVYYLKIGNRFCLDNKSQENKPVKNAYCHLCSETHDLIANAIDVPLKFYILDKEYFFNGFNKKNAYKSFGLCESCYQKALVGSTIIYDKYRFSFFDNDDNKSLKGYLIIPKEVDSVEMEEYQAGVEKLSNFFSKKPKDLETEFGKAKIISKGSKVKFDLLFFKKNQSSLKIKERFTDIKFDHIVSLQKTLRKTANLFDERSRLHINFNNIYHLLFKPGKGQKMNVKQYRELIKSLLNNYPISENTLQRLFVETYRGQFFINKKNKNYFLETDTLRYQILINWINDLGLLRRTDLVVEDKSKYLPIDNVNSSIIDFVSKDERFMDSMIKQGLLTLGFLVGVIYNQQRENKTTIYDSINFNGMSKYQLETFIFNVSDKLNLIKKDNKKLIRDYSKELALTINRLRDIEKIEISSNEILIDILTGFSLAVYNS